MNLKGSKKRETGRNWLNENSIAKGKSIQMAQICRVFSYTNGFPCNPVIRRDVLSGPQSFSPSPLTSKYQSYPTPVVPHVMWYIFIVWTKQLGPKTSKRQKDQGVNHWQCPSVVPKKAGVPVPEHGRNFPKKMKNIFPLLSLPHTLAKNEAFWSLVGTSTKGRLNWRFASDGLECIGSLLIH